MKNCYLTLHSVSGKLFFCLQSRNPSKICPVVRAWRTCFLFVCEELDPYMIFCLAHFQNLPQLSKVTEFNTDLNTRDRQMSSNVCLLKLKEKQQHIKNAIRSQSMASLSQIPVLNFSVYICWGNEEVKAEFLLLALSKLRHWKLGAIIKLVT